MRLTTIEIVTDIEECEGHSLERFIERIQGTGDEAPTLRFCDECAVRLRGEIREAMRAAVRKQLGDDDFDDGVPV